MMLKARRELFEKPHNPQTKYNDFVHFHENPLKSLTNQQLVTTIDHMTYI